MVHWLLIFTGANGTPDRQFFLIDDWLPNKATCEARAHEVAERDGWDTDAIGFTCIAYPWVGI